MRFVFVFLVGGATAALALVDDRWHVATDVVPPRKEMASLAAMLQMSWEKKPDSIFYTMSASRLTVFAVPVFLVVISLIALCVFLQFRRAQQKGFVNDWYCFDSEAARMQLSRGVPGAVWLTDKRLFAMLMQFHSKGKPVTHRTKDMPACLNSTVHEQPECDVEDGQCNFGRFGVIPTYLAQGGGCMILPEIKDDAKSSFPWFVKAVDVDAGKGVSCYMTFEECVRATWCTGIDKEQRMRAYVIQPHVARPMLIDGYKFDLRLHVVLVAQKGATDDFENPAESLKAFLFEEALVRLSNAPWSQENTKMNVQYRESTLLMSWHMEFHQRLLRNIPHGEEILSACTEAIEHCLSCARPYLHQGTRVNARQVLGIDVMIDEDRRAWVIEVNGWPGNTPDKYTQANYEQLHLRIKRDLPVLVSQPLLEGRPAQAIEGWQELHF